MQKMVDVSLQLLALEATKDSLPIWMQFVMVAVLLCCTIEAYPLACIRKKKEENCRLEFLLISAYKLIIGSIKEIKYIVVFGSFRKCIEV